MCIRDSSEAVRKLLMYATLCCDGSYVVEASGEKHIGDPTETSILKASYLNGMPKEELLKRYERLGEIPFDSDRKLMTTINRIDGKYMVIVKGAFDIMEKRCVRGDLKKARNMNDDMSKQALRVLAIGYKEIEALPQNLVAEEMENGLTPVSYTHLFTVVDVQ